MSYHKNNKRIVPFSEISYLGTPCENKIIIYLKDGRDLQITGEEANTFQEEYEAWLSK